MAKDRKPFDNEEEPIDDEEEPRNVCKSCVYFDAELDDATEETIAPCLHPDLEEFELMVSGDSSCNLFEPREEEEESDENEEDEEEEEEE
jgi:hypothetical protein